MNTGASWPSLEEARKRVRGIQTKLHRWATDDPHRRFNDLYNLVYDPAFLVMAWARVRGNKGARTAGVDGQTARYIEAGRGVEAFLDDLRGLLKARTFTPLPVRERSIPKREPGKVRRLGIPATRDRVVQAALKLVLEPILEADFKPSSYGFRPNRRAHDAVAEIRQFTSKRYEWVVEADIEACFDELSHTAILDRLRKRVGDRRVLVLVKAFLKAGVLTEEGAMGRDSVTGTPQGGILSPLMANLALNVLDEHFASMWGKTQPQRVSRSRRGLGNYRLVRYADDFVVMVYGTREHAEALIPEVAAVLAPLGLRLSEEKTRVVHIDEGLDFLGWHIQRRFKRGTGGRQRYVYNYPSKRAMLAVMEKVRALSRRGMNRSFAALLRSVNSVLRGWTTYFRPGVSNVTFAYLRWFAFKRVGRWLRRKYPRRSWKWLRRFTSNGWWPASEGVVLFNPEAAGTTRYRYRGSQIPTPWTNETTEAVA